jgi:hypothetical protein
MSQAVGNGSQKLGFRLEKSGVVTADDFTRERLSHDCNLAAERRGPPFELPGNDAQALRLSIIEDHLVCHPQHRAQARSQASVCWNGVLDCLGGPLDSRPHIARNDFETLYSLTLDGPDSEVPLLRMRKLIVSQFTRDQREGFDQLLTQIGGPAGIADALAGG